MKLTNYLRDAFTRSVMDDVPCIDYDEQIRSLIMKKALERLPKAVLALWKDPKTKAFVAAGTCRVGGNNSVGIDGVPGFCGSSWNSELVGASAEEAKAFFAQFDEILAKRKEQKQHREDLDSKVHAVAYSCSTRKALLERLPEFEKYLPEEASKVTHLPAITNLMGDLVKAGWPKSEHDRRAKVKAKLDAKNAGALVPA